MPSPPLPPHPNGSYCHVLDCQLYVMVAFAPLRYGFFMGKKKKADQASALSVRQNLFVDEYISNGGNGTAAFVAAFENHNRASAAELASRMLRNVEILDAIERRRRSLAYANSFEKDEYVRILVAQARHNPGLIRDKINEDVPLTREEKSALDCKPTDRKAALDELAQIFGFKDKGDQDDCDDLDQSVVDAVERIKSGRKES